MRAGRARLGEGPRGSSRATALNDVLAERKEPPPLVPAVHDRFRIMRVCASIVQIERTISSAV